MRTVTLSQLRSDARLYADERPGGAAAFIDDTELDRLINLSVASLYDKLLMAGGHEYYVQTYSGNLTANSATYGSPLMPTDHYRTLRLYLQWDSNDHEDLRSIGMLEKGRFNNYGSWGRDTPKGYRITGGGSLEVYPTPTASTSIVHVYTPAFTDMTMTTDTFNGVNGWERVVALDVAIQMRVIREKPYSDLEALFQRDWQRIETAAGNRTQYDPPHVVDVYPEGGRGQRHGWPSV